MSTALKSIQEKLTGAKTVLNSLLGHLQQLKESAHSAYLENARIGAEGEGGDLQSYQDALHTVYGITIEGDVALDYTSLENYHVALDRFADFLEKVQFPDSVSMNNRYQLFLNIMGRMTINRTTERHEDSGNTAPGYSAGHVIWDMYTLYEVDDDGARVGEKRRPNPMTANNFIHELFHSFNMFAGFGGQREGSLFMITDIIQMLPDIYTEEGELEKKGLLSLIEMPRESSSTLDSELLADLGLFASYGLIDDEQITSAYEIAVRQASIYHMTPEQYSSSLGSGQVIVGTLNPGIRLRITPVSGREWLSVADTKRQVSILGKDST